MMPHFQLPEPRTDRTTSPTISTTRNSPKQENQNTAPSISTSNSKPDRIRIKNRRKRYLDLHPEFFTSPDLELSDPLLYDHLVRRHQTAQERETQGRHPNRPNHTTSSILETSLLRSEAKLQALRSLSTSPNAALSYKRAPDGYILALDRDEEGFDSRDAAWGRWVEVMTQRFLRGKVEGFEYWVVDEGEEFDDLAEEERGRFEGYVGEQTPEFVGEGTPKGETGVQDF